MHENDLSQLFRAFFTQIHVQSQIVAERRIIFHVVEYLLNNKNRRNQLQKNLGSEFVLAFIQAVDAEKDPINMKVIFGLWPIVLKVFYNSYLKLNIILNIKNFHFVEFSTGTFRRRCV